MQSQYFTILVRTQEDNPSLQAESKQWKKYYRKVKNSCLLTNGPFELPFDQNSGCTSAATCTVSVYEQSKR